MGQAATQFEYGSGGGSGAKVVSLKGRVQDRGSLALAVSIFADRSYLRAEMEEDASAAGLRIAQAGDLGNLLAADGVQAHADAMLGDLVLVCRATFTVRMRDNQDKNPVCRDWRRA